MLVKQKIKYIQSLGQKKFRQQEEVFIAEGPKLLKELLDEDTVTIKEVFALKEWITAHPDLPGHLPVTAITEEELEKISHLTTPNKVLAIVQQFNSAAIPDAKGRIILALDEVQDPGNLGTIIRIADWFGIEHIVCSSNSADCYNPKVVQSTMGSIARVQVHYLELEAWLLAQQPIPVYAAGLEGQSIITMEKIKEGILVFGNESKGISSELLQLATSRITIPRKGKAESLNVAVAVGLVTGCLCG